MFHREIIYAPDGIRGLDVKRKVFEAALLARGYRAQGFDLTDREGFVDWEEREDEFERFDPATVSPGVLYPSCLEARKTPLQLRKDSALFERLGRKWSTVLGIEGARLEPLVSRKAARGAIIFQGYEPSNWVVRMAMIRRGLPVLGLENTALTDRVCWDAISGITVNRNAAASYFWRYEDAVEEGPVTKFVDDLLESTTARKSEQHRCASGAPPGTGGKPMMLYLGQVYVDSSVIFGLRDWESPVEVVRALVRECGRKNMTLILKLHPKEALKETKRISMYYQWQTRQALESDQEIGDALKSGEVLIDADNSWNTYSLIEQADLVATINSQAGLEALVRGKPVILFGNAFYGNLGFTDGVRSEEELGLVLSRLLGDDRGREERLGRARLFAYIYFELYCRRKSVSELVKLVKTMASGDFESVPEQT